VRTAFKLHCHASAYEDGPGLGHVFLRIVARSGWSGLAVGGSDALARALVSVIEHHGGVIVPGQAVTGIGVRSGRATGVTLADGTTITAERFVVSGIDPPQTLRITGEEWFGADAVREVRGYRWAETSLVTLHLALSAPPAYIATRFDPDVARAFGIYLGAESSAAIGRQLAAIRRGELPDRFAGNGACNTLADPSQAPVGRHTAFWWPWAPYDLDGDADSWDRRRAEIGERILAEWTEYAPNLGGVTVLGSSLFTPLDISRRCINMVRGSHHNGAYAGGQIDAGRPTPSLAGYRTPVTGLYLCGASSHPGGSIHGAPGYNAANVIAEDLGVDRWWTPVVLPAFSG
jgi:phytoene dehydrogenase-like protein